MGYFFESAVWSNGAHELFSAILGDLFCNSMAPLAQNVREDPQIVPWNTCNNNTEFEGGRQNMIGFSCKKVVYDCIRYVPVKSKLKHPPGNPPGI